MMKTCKKCNIEIGPKNRTMLCVACYQSSIKTNIKRNFAYLNSVKPISLKAYRRIVAADNGQLTEQQEEILSRLLYRKAAEIRKAKNDDAL